MKKKRIMASFPIRILAVSIPGLLAGLFLNATRTMGLTSGALNLVVTARYVLSQIITFLAPLIIIGLVASSIISVKKAPTPVTAPIVRISLCHSKAIFHPLSLIFSQPYRKFLCKDSADVLSFSQCSLYHSISK